jgi:mRNA interferase MazF
VVVIQANSFNESRIQTVVVAVITSNLALAMTPGNVRLPSKQTKLSKDSVVNVSQLLTVDRSLLTECIGRIPEPRMAEIEAGLRLVLGI